MPWRFGFIFFACGQRRDVRRTPEYSTTSTTTTTTTTVPRRKKLRTSTRDRMHKEMKKVYRSAERRVHEVFLYDRDEETVDGRHRDARAIFTEFDGKHFFRAFVLGELLGEGGFSRVFKATVNGAPEGSTLYAVKRCRRRGMTSKAKRQLYEEVHILRHMHHPNVVALYQFYPIDPIYYYMVMEYMAGGELFDSIFQKYTREETYDEEEARDLCKAVVSAVRYCHDRGVVHRDLKPENLLLASPKDSSSVKLADFGLACSVADGPAHAWCGTPGYIAPEVITRKPYGTAVDMWGIGVIIYFLIAGYPPFYDREVTNVYRRTKAGRFEFDQKDWMHTSEEAKDFIRRLLTVDETKRMTAAEAMHHPWLTASGQSLATNNLKQNLERFSIFNARRNYRAAIRGVVLAKALASIAEEPPSDDFSKAFDLGEEVEAGSISTVFKATAAAHDEEDSPKPGDWSKQQHQQQHNQRCYAVKRIKRSVLCEDDERKVSTEVRILRRLDHPNIGSIYEFFEEDPAYYYLVLEFMGGGEFLDHVVLKPSFTEEDARDLCKVLLETVKYCHDRGVVHRDLQPENLLMGDDGGGGMKLTNFGQARCVFRGDLTEICGTPEYMAPEMLRGIPYGASVDVWSAGVIIFTLLVGSLPFHDQDQTRLFHNIKAGNFSFDEEYWGGISNEAKDLVRKLLTVDCTKRVTASVAIGHPWLRAKGRSLACRNLQNNVEQLQLFNARRKLRRAVRLRFSKTTRLERQYQRCSVDSPDLRYLQTE